MTTPLTVQTSSVNKITNSNLKFKTCSYTLIKGPKKGAGCSQTPHENGYCKKHLRLKNVQIKLGIYKAKTTKPNEPNKRCTYILKKGKRKDNGCGRKVYEAEHCKTHHSKLTLDGNKKESKNNIYVGYSTDIDDCPFCGISYCNCGYYG